MMDDRYGLRTPEQVELGYDVAGLGSRFMAALVDGCIQGVVLVAIAIAGVWGGALSSQVGVRLARRLASERAAGDEVTAILAVVALVVFAVTWGYSIFFELVWNGQTPGKRLAGLRVLTIEGRPVTPVHVLVRNLLRAADILPSSYMLGAAVMLLNRRAQRLGDLAAGTIVVKERREPLPRALAGQAAAELAPQEAALFTAEDVALARDFLLRREELSPERRRSLAERIAARLRARLEPEAPAEPAESLLARVAALNR